MKQFFHDLLTEGNPKSSRRFVTLIICALFILTCSTIPILLIALFLYVNKLQGINIEALKLIIDVVKTVLEYEMIIIGLGLFFTSTSMRLAFVKEWFQSRKPAAEPPQEPFNPIP